MKKLAFVGGAAAVLAACASPHNNPAPSVSDLLMDATGQKGRACVQQNDIQGYGILDNNWVSVDARRNYYLARLMPGCNSMATSARAAFESRTYEICGGGSSQLHTADDSCTIRYLFEFESREEAFAAYSAAVDTRKELQQQQEREE